MHLISMYFIYIRSSLPLNEPSPEVVLETTPLPEMVLVSEYKYVHGVHTMAPNSMVSTCKIACIHNTFTRT